MNDIVRVAVTGVGGRMGKKIVQAISRSEKVSLGGAITSPSSNLFGMDAGEQSNVGCLNVKINHNLNLIKNDFDVLIDFTNPEASLSYINWCEKNNKNIVIGTTGFNKHHQLSIKEASKKIGILLSANFSIGINVMMKVLEKVTKAIGKTSDIDIIEFHHNKKIDSPSGTALSIGKIIAKSMNYNFEDCIFYNNKRNEIRSNKKIGFSSIRSGDIIGEHNVIFSKIGERLEISHKASDRMTFAIGAVKAAIWLQKKKNGIFNMHDVLNINKI